MKKFKLEVLFYIMACLVTTGVKGQDLQILVNPFMKTQVEQFSNVRDLSMSEDGNEVYYSVQSYLGELSVIVTTQKVGGNWSSPQVASFSGRYMDMEPFLTPNGLKLFFFSAKVDWILLSYRKYFN